MASTPEGRTKNQQSRYMAEKPRTKAMVFSAVTRGNDELRHSRRDRHVDCNNDVRCS